ncbi:ATP-binding protein [Isoptericola jiangsuensis]|uniref:ATP-binding protein n=1 Tax=Isoptericola jiangsuensis TaxID=548579 RepID=UPI003AAB87ED
MALDLHPFTPERLVGTVFEVEGSYVGVAFADASKLPRSLFGEYVGRGEVGEFLIVDVGGVGAFGRVVSVETPVTNSDNLGRTDSDRRIPVQGKFQLLSTLRLDGTSFRGIEKYPRIGDPVYAASGQSIGAVLDATPSGAGVVPIGRLSVDESLVVNVPLARLFGRHLAVVGATGSGKSWTLGHLAESVAALNGKMILIDATGEFRTLAAAKHLAFADSAGEPTGTTVIGVPHYRMRESDRNAFLLPSAGAQLPKLREAVRSLKLAHAISSDTSASTAHRNWVSANGTVVKASRSIVEFQALTNEYSSATEKLNAPFDISLLAAQVQNECIWPTGRGPTAAKFGDANQNDLGYVSSLISRVNDLLQMPEIMKVIDPNAAGTADAVSEIAAWLKDDSAPLLRISLRNLTFENHLREIVVNILGQVLLSAARKNFFSSKPLVVAVDEAHQFFDVTVGDEYATSRLNAFDSIAKEGRKYGLTACVVTQRPSDLPAGVFSQVGMTIVHRLAEGRDRQRIEQAAAEIDHSATRLLPGLVPGEAILMGVDFPVPVSVRIQRPVHPPASDGPDYAAWERNSIAELI